MKDCFSYEAHDYRIRPLGADDAVAFQDFYRALARPEHYVDFLKDKNLDDLTVWKDLLNAVHEADFHMFGLWDGPKLIGQTGLAYREADGKTIACYTGSQIADHYQGRGLSKMLYDVRKEYLKGIDFNGPQETYIEPDNKKSIGAAKKNGFVVTDDPLRDEKYLTLRLQPVSEMWLHNHRNGLKIPDKNL